LHKTDALINISGVLFQRIFSSGRNYRQFPIQKKNTNSCASSGCRLTYIKKAALLQKGLQK
jgi:hypothetical protein